MPYNLEKTDWKEFDRELKDSSNQAEFQWNLTVNSQVEELENTQKICKFSFKKQLKKRFQKEKLLVNQNLNKIIILMS